MNTHNYDRSQAERLVPLLKAIARELQERSGHIDQLERELETLRGDERSGPKGKLLVRLVEHRRALNEAERELAALGCALDEDHPLRVLIPGDRGEFEGGFAFDAVRNSLEPLPVDSVR
ncbi:MAG: DUF2203 family protein [Planctomycetes bacterium]|nr:DUF2203 family protein [Planctomycetota bacterium]